MSSDQELDAIIKATQTALGKYIKKPPLTEKLLKKPPFRFLMDVFNSFIKQTGNFEGLYTTEEQQFENIGDREAKTRFLQKMIDAIKLTTKKDLKVRTSKIVAGQEPELTNELLQAMASVAEQSLDWQKAVEQVLMAGTAAATSKPAKEKSKKDPKPSSKQTSPAGKEEETKRVKEKRVSPQEQKLRKATQALASGVTPTEKEKATQKKTKATVGDAKPSRQGSKQKSPSPVKQKAKAKGQGSTESDTMSPVPVAVAKKPSPETVPKKASSEAVPMKASPDVLPKKSSPESVLKKGSPEVVPKGASPEVAPKKASPEVAPKKASSEVAPKKSSPSSSPKVSKEAVAEPAMETNLTAPPTESESRKSSSKSRRSSASQRQVQAEPEQPAPNEVKTQQQQQPEPNQQADSNNNQDGRTVAAPLTRENSKETNQRPRTSLRPPSARPASARPGAPRRRNVEIVLQPNDQLKMSGINVKLETFGDLDDDGENLVIIEDANAHDIEKGAAEEPLLESQLDAQGRLVQQILETQKELVQQSAEAEQPATQPNQGTRQSSARQVNDLRDLIQSLTKAINPLGKLMDFIPEDIDAMQLELTMWRDTYTQAATELKRERSLTASATEPMKDQLMQIDASIVEYEELIDESRQKILQNNARILKMLMEQ
ncbi:TRAF3-interacting protein 1 [Drosophila pseudoobscura]|uniref:TRAF3-interacting protein 1 n=1 Tax=Drosophila pseudoobscura pseudoobscura TaxID=46245 RepID=A0A6I8UP40_DROPS|nr:TRAF3-interacting protein 1 [Drosophila pseudoobscura]